MMMGNGPGLFPAAMLEQEGEWFLLLDTFMLSEVFMADVVRSASLKL